MIGAHSHLSKQRQDDFKNKSMTLLQMYTEKKIRVSINGLVEIQS